MLCKSNDDICHFRCVLKNISFDIEQGKCIALIGKNGAGKSTLIDILIGNVNA
ncbi:ATP-binding cassette domain-containing protein, partial [Staphylococcus aureus]|uniref:ATP-binding cassette domain-containing protein n=1 Tax=Staphylococcus aureus TaxID=1280 RepID=UPI00301BB81E